MSMSGFAFGDPLPRDISDEYLESQSLHSNTKAKGLILIEEGRAAVVNFRESAGSIHVADAQAVGMLDAIADRIMEIVDQLCANVSEMDLNLANVAALYIHCQDLIDEENVGAAILDARRAFQHGLEEHRDSVWALWQLENGLKTWIFEGDVVMAGQMGQE